jgi:PLP dependent protein
MEKQLLENLKMIYRRMAHAAMRAGREPADVRLIGVTKNIEVALLRAAVAVGMREFGENRVQEAQKKMASEELKVSNGRVHWHLIGHLQKNKAKTAVALFDLIHSVDSFELAEELDRQAAKLSKKQRVLIQVKLSEEESKYGIHEDALPDLIRRIAVLGNIKLEGLMTIPPFFDDSEEARPYFRKLFSLRNAAEEAGFLLPELSMGMSNDFEVAIQEGATMVRVGTAIFGERKYT